MSLFMSDSLKEKIDLKTLEKDSQNLKIDSLFYCLFSTRKGVYYTTLHKFKKVDKGAIIVFSSDLGDQSMLSNLLDASAIEKVTVCVSGGPESMPVFETHKNFNATIEEIERESLSGYNYLITIFIGKARARRKQNV